MNDVQSPTSGAVFYPASVPFAKKEVFLLVVVPILVISAWILGGEIVFLPSVAVALLVIYWSLTSLHVWLTLTILGHAVLFFQKTEGVSISEIGFAFYSFGILLIWFYDRWVRGYAFTSTVGDRSLFLFLVLATVSIIPALAYGNKMDMWFREWIVLMAFLLYFPMREMLADTQGRRLAYGAFFLLGLTLAIQNFIQYRSGALVAEFYWQLVGARQASYAPIFMSLLLAFGALWMTTRTVRAQLISVLAVSFFALALIFTFARGFWIGALLGGVVLLFLGRSHERRRLLSIVLIVLLLSSLILLIFFYDILTSLLATIAYRFITSAAGTQDISVANRLAETAAIWKAILANPLTGVGLGGEYAFHSLIRKTTQHTIYAHNAYLYFLFKLGIAGLLIFLVAYFSKIRAGIHRLREEWRSPLRPYQLASVAILVAMVQISITSPQFYARDSILIIVLCWGTIAARVQSDQVPIENSTLFPSV